MATIASLIVEISAKSIKLKSGLTKASSKIKAFAKRSAKVLAGIGASVSVGAVAGITAVIVTVNKYAAQIDKLAKTSSKLGITVKALQKLQYQAELTGVSTDTMNMAMQRMVRRVSEAAKGTGEAKNALKELGLSASYLSQLSPDKQFYAISEAMKAIGNQGDKVRLAMKIFDTEGVSLVNTMNGNLKQMGAEFDSLGISITGSAAKMVEAYNDSKTKLSAIFSGFGIQLTAQLAGPFTKLIEWITLTVQKMGGMEMAAKNFAKFIINGIKSSISAVQLLIKGFVKLENLMLRIENIKLLPAIAGEAVASQVVGTPGVVGENTQKAFDNQDQITRNNLALKDNSAINSLDKLLLSLEKEIGKKMDLSDVIKPEHYKAFDKAANDADIMARSTSNAAQKTNDLANAVDKARQSISPTKADAKAGINTSSSFSKIGGLNPGLSGFSAGGRSSASTATESAKKAIQSSSPSLGTFKIDMQTDAGKISGELFGEPSFITSLKTFTDKSTNQSARMAAM